MSFARSLVLALFSCGWGANAPTHAANVENGRYLFYAGGCASCHAAPASAKCDDPNYKDAFLLTGGRCLKSNFGTFYVPNISPDKQFGIGGWSDADFLRAMTEGVSPTGKNYYPAFPYASYRHMKKEDLLDVKAFLKTLTPSPSKVPESQIAFPYNLREGLGFWKWLYLTGEPFTSDPSKSAQVNRGAYLVQGPGHCGECHSPRTSLGGMIAAKMLAGAPDPTGKGFIPNLTPDKTGLASWSAKDIAYALETGFTPDGDVLGGSMAKVQENMAKLTAEDREAIAAYLKSIPAIPAVRPPKSK